MKNGRKLVKSRVGRNGGGNQKGTDMKRMRVRSEYSQLLAWRN